MEHDPMFDEASTARRGRWGNLKAPTGYMTMKDGAARVGMHESNFRRKVRLEIRKIFKRSDGAVFVRASDVEAMRAEREAERRIVATETKTPPLAKKKRVPAAPPPPPPKPEPGDAQGRLYSEAFERFQAGKSVVDVVIELQVTAEVAETVWGHYLRLRKAIPLLSHHLTILQAQLPSWDEEPPTGDGLCRALLAQRARAQASPPAPPAPRPRTPPSGAGEAQAPPTPPPPVERELTDDERVLMAALNQEPA